MAVECAGLAQEEESGKPVAVLIDPESPHKQADILDVDQLLDRLNEHGINDQSPILKMLIQVFEMFSQHFNEMKELPLLRDLMQGLTPDTQPEAAPQPQPDQAPHMQVQAAPTPTASM